MLLWHKTYAVRSTSFDLTNLKTCDIVLFKGVGVMYLCIQYLHNNIKYAKKHKLMTLAHIIIILL